MKAKLLALLLISLSIGSAQPQSFLKKMGKELKKAATEAAKDVANELLKPESETPELSESPADSKPQPAATVPAATGTAVWNETTFSIPRITPDTKFMKVPEIYVASDVHDGIFSIKDIDTELIAFFTKDGKCLFGYDWLSAGTDPRFDSGACIVRSKEKRGSTYPLCILYRNGNVKELKPEYRKPTQFVDGVARVQKAGPMMQSEWVYINTAGEEIYPNLNEPVQFTAEGVGKLSENLRPHYSYADKKWGYINTKGEIVIKPQFDKARPFSEGLAAVCIREGWDNIWGFIDKTGKQIIAPQFKGYISDCRNGYITWRDSDNSIDRILDRTGKEVASFNSATPFFNGYAFVYKKGFHEDDLLTVIDKNLNEVRKTSKFYIDKNDVKPDGVIPGEAGVYSISGGGGDPFVVTPDGRVVIRTWNIPEHRSAFGHIGPFTEDFLARTRTSVGETEYDGLIDPMAQFTLIFIPPSSNISDVIEDPSYEFPPYYPATDSLSEQAPGQEPVPAPRPIIFPIRVKYTDPTPIGPKKVDNPTYTVTTIANPPAGGTITGAGTYKFGESAKISASAHEGWKLTGITCSSSRIKADGNSSEFLIDGEDLTFTANFIKKDTIIAIPRTTILAGTHAIKAPEEPNGMNVPCTVYLEQDSGKVLSTPYGQETYGFLTAIIDSDKLYNSPLDGSNGDKISAKFFFAPMRISGLIETAGKRYLVVDGGQLMVGGINVDMSDPLSHLFLNFIMSFNGNTVATVSDGRYRIEMTDCNDETGEFTLGQMERYSTVYGWLPSDDSRLKSSGKNSLFFGFKDTNMPMPRWLFNGCKLTRSEKRDDIQWAPPENWYESRSLFDKICKELGNFMYNMRTDADQFWDEE